MYVVKTTYSFDDDVVSKYFGSLDHAKEWLAKDTAEEFRIQREENGWDPDMSIARDRMSSKITTPTRFGEDDVMEWKIHEVDPSDLSLGDLMSASIFVLFPYLDYKSGGKKIKIEVNEFRIGGIFRGIRMIRDFQLAEDVEFVYSLVLKRNGGVENEAVMAYDGRIRKASPDPRTNEPMPVFWSLSEAMQAAGKLKEKYKDRDPVVELNVEEQTLKFDRTVKSAVK